MTWETILAILAVTLPVLSSVLTAILNNWDKINPSKRKVKEMYDLIQNILQRIDDNTQKSNELSDKMDIMSSAQRTLLQSIILADCKHIQSAIDKGDTDYEEELKQLIILYHEYFLCGYNSQGRLYFNDTIAKAAEDNNTLVHELMNRYFPEYNPSTH